MLVQGLNKSHQRALLEGKVEAGSSWLEPFCIQMKSMRRFFKCRVAAMILRKWDSVVLPCLLCALHVHQLVHLVSVLAVRVPPLFHCSARICQVPELVPLHMFTVAEEDWIERFAVQRRQIRQRFQELFKRLHGAETLGMCQGHDCRLECGMVRTLSGSRRLGQNQRALSPQNSSCTCSASLCSSS